MVCWSSKNHANAVGMDQALRQPPNPSHGGYFQERYQSLLGKKTARVFYCSRTWGGQEGEVHKTFAQSSVTQRYNQKTTIWNPLSLLVPDMGR